MSENENNIEFPVEYTRRKLNALYREIPLKDTTSRLLRKYFCAMANLYGVIRLGKAYEIISELSPSLVTKEEFLAFAEIARHEDEFYYILGREELFSDVRKGSPLDREIICIDLLDDEMKSYIETINRQEGKPYYIPTKKELLCYVDDYYVEKTPQAAALKACLMKCFRIDAEEAEELLGNISIEARRTGNCFQNVFDMFEMCGYEFRNDKDAEKFIGLYQDFHNTSRKQTNRGYTPTELNEMCPPEERMPKSLSFGPNIKKSIASGDMNADELRKAIMAMDFPNEELRRSILNEIDKANKNQPVRSEKIGRNEPCPCGSGKKYKNCCGR